LGKIYKLLVIWAVLLIPTLRGFLVGVIMWQHQQGREKNFVMG